MLRLDLAQYRELQAFAQFGSDLDKATQARLVRGERMTETLKQLQYIPMPVERQVAIIYTGINGYLDDMPIHQVADFERGFLNFIDDKHPQIYHNFNETKDLQPDVEELLKKAILEFKVKFIAERKTEEKS